MLSDHSKEFIVVYPKGLNKHWNDGRANTNADVDDIGFFKQLAKHLKNDLRLPVNASRIFVTGISNGGLMAIRVACEQPGWTAGVGVVAATMSDVMAPKCKTSPGAMVFIFGDQDSSFLSDGRQVNPVNPSQFISRHVGIKKTLKLAAAMNQCQRGSSRSKPIDRYDDDHSKVVIEKFRGCIAPLVFYDVLGGGHTWPDTRAKNGVIARKMLNLGWATHEISSAQEIWKVFKQLR